MKILGLLSIAVAVIISYCVYNPNVNAADLNSTETKTSSSTDCKGPFGFDSQKVLSMGHNKYIIGIVSSIDLSKNSDGTWYVSTCRLLDNHTAVSFARPYPQQNDLKEGDFIGFSAVVGFNSFGVGRYNSAKILDYISRQSVDCKIDNMSQLSRPYTADDRPRFDTEEYDVTGVIMAINISWNSDPEPDNPDDYQISSAVMKCSDGNLYIVYFSDRNTEVNLPRHDAFGEGDVVTVTQTSFIGGSAPLMDNTPFFFAYWDNSSSPKTNTKATVTDNTKGNIGTSMMPYPVEDFADDQTYKVLNIIDANTIEIDYKGKKIEFDLIGVGVLDGSKIGDMNPYRFEAEKPYIFTKYLLHGESVYLRFDSQQNKIDYSDRISQLSGRNQPAYVYRAPDGLFVNLELIRQGYGIIRDKYFRHHQLFRYYEDKAREARKGIHYLIPSQLLKQYKMK